MEVLIQSGFCQVAVLDNLKIWISVSGCTIKVCQTMGSTLVLDERFFYYSK